MTCVEVRRLLSAYIDSEVDETTRHAVAEHLEQCDSCRREFQTLLKTVKMIRSLRQVPWSSPGGRTVRAEKDK
jgi:predicted anti-sigma-YlaC factor YlaD